jgi:hypothetical protein
MTSEVNQSFETIVTHKAHKMVASVAYKNYARELLQELSETRLEQAFILGAMDATIYDLACAMDFTKRKGTVNDYSSYSQRKRLIQKILDAEK